MSEVDLVQAIIIQAVRDYKCSNKRAKNKYMKAKYRRLSARAKAWILSGSKEESSFNWCCGIVGVSASMIRDKLFGGQE